VTAHETMIVHTFNTEAVELQLIHLNAKCNKAGLFVEHHMEHLPTTTR
jgi:hypothetical protein